LRDRPKAFLTNDLRKEHFKRRDHNAEELTGVAGNPRQEISLIAEVRRGGLGLRAARGANAPRRRYETKRQARETPASGRENEIPTPELQMRPAMSRE